MTNLFRPQGAFGWFSYTTSWDTIRYTIPQEEQLADDKRPDLRFQSSLFDGPVPVELKLADKWTGSQLFERLENQPCGDYLRDIRSSCGIFLLVNHGNKQNWELSDGKPVAFNHLVTALQEHWTALAARYPNAEDIRVIGIDLTKRGVGAAKKPEAQPKKARKARAPRKQN